MTDARVSAVAIEVAAQPQADARLSALAVEVAAQPQSDSRLSALAIEVVVGLTAVADPASPQATFISFRR